jgi:hypothetical protein
LEKESRPEAKGPSSLNEIPFKIAVQYMLVVIYRDNWLEVQITSYLEEIDVAQDDNGRFVSSCQTSARLIPFGSSIALREPTHSQ